MVIYLGNRHKVISKFNRKYKINSTSLSLLVDLIFLLYIELTMDIFKRIAVCEDSINR